jgi:hypothetical protein
LLNRAGRLAADALAEVAILTDPGPTPGAVTSAGWPTADLPSAITVYVPRSTSTSTGCGQYDAALTRAVAPCVKRGNCGILVGRMRLAILGR